MKKISLIFIAFVLAACQSMDNSTISPFTEAPLFGMIYDSESSPVSGAKVILDDTATAFTDINGRVVLQAVSRGEHTVVIQKKGFEEMRIKVNFSSREQVLYANLLSMDTILGNMEKALLSGKLTEAEAFMQRASSINPRNIRLQYLIAMYHVRKKSYAQALTELKRLSAQYPDDPYLVMTRAHILFFGLGQKDSSIRILQSYFSLHTNEEVENLIKTLSDRQVPKTKQDD